MQVKSLEEFTSKDFTRIVITLYPFVEATADAPDAEAFEDLGRRFMEFFEE